MKNLSNLDRLIKLQNIKNLPPEIIKDFTNYFDANNNRFDSVEMLKPVHFWFEILEDLKCILSNYYIVEPNSDNEVFVDNNVLSGGYVNLISKYKDKLIKDVYTIHIKSAYPQQIDKMFMNGMKANDPYLPFIFHLVYKGVKTKTQIRKMFLNYFFGILASGNYKIKLNRNISEIPEFYNNFWKSINQKLYYYIDTDIIMCNKINVKKITDIMQHSNIEFEVESDIYDILFLNTKKYIKLKNNILYKIVGLKSLK